MMMLRLSLVIITLFFNVSTVNALSLSHAYDLAITHDPQYQAIIHERAAGLENITIGRSNLLPKITASHFQAKNDIQIRNLNNNAMLRDENNYGSRFSQLQLVQPLINYEALAKFRQGLSQSSYSQKKLELAQMDLIIRLLQNYIDILVTSDQRKLLQSEIIFLQEQLKSIKLGRQAGESTITEELEVQANLSITQAQLYAAESQIKDLNTRLARMLGMDPQKDIRLPAIRLPLKGLTILAIEHDNYIKMAVETNLEIASQKLMTEIALQEFKKNNSGHMPRVDIVANALRQDSYSSNTIDQRINQNYLGFQLSIPIFSGFETQGRSAQAYSNYLKERELERAAENKVLNELQEELSRLANLQKQVQALQMATEAASKAVVATEKGIASGYRTRIDLLNMLKATQKAKKELLNAHYSYLVSYLKIKLISNQFKVDDLKLIDQQFTYANHQ